MPLSKHPSYSYSYWESASISCQYHGKPDVPYSWKSHCTTCLLDIQYQRVEWEQCTPGDPLLRGVSECALHGSYRIPRVFGDKFCDKFGDQFSDSP